MEWLLSSFLLKVHTNLPHGDRLLEVAFANTIDPPLVPTR